MLMWHLYTIFGEVSRKVFGPIYSGGLFVCGLRVLCMLWITVLSAMNLADTVCGAWLAF